MTEPGARSDGNGHLDSIHVDNPTAAPTRPRAVPAPAARAVTAVIPTRNRPALLRQAIESVLAQEHVDVSVLVVIDGPPDAESEAVVREFAGERVEALPMPQNRGPAACRMVGAMHAVTPYVAFLDDDDLWLPGKLAAQLAALPAGDEVTALVSCRSHVETPSGRYVWPRRLPKPNQRTGDWLFCRRSLFKGDSFIQASSILCHRSLVERVPQRDAEHEDWDWVLQATEAGGARLIVVPETLVVHLAEFRGASLSNKHKLEGSLLWALSIRKIISPEAFAGLLLQILNGAVTERGDWRTGLRLLQIAARQGRPRPLDLCMFALQWAIPAPARRRLRSLVYGAGRKAGIRPPSRPASIGKTP